MKPDTSNPFYILDELIKSDPENDELENDELNFLTHPIISFLDESESEEEKSEIIHLPEGKIDPRLKLLSHSSRTLLHKCPRKFQLYRLSSTKVLNPKLEEKEREQEITFSYGKSLGVGIQAILTGESLNQVYLKTLLSWEADLFAVNQKKKKSIWEVLFSLEKFLILRDEGYLQDYELVIYENAPAVELSFCIELPNGFMYRGFVDAVLQNKVTNKVIVLEFKTTGNTPSSANYKNSGQALGYSIILDILFKKLSSYEVLYLVYHSTNREFVEFYFEKSALQRALWLQELIIDSNIIELYAQNNNFPMHGESCFDFFRECEYLDLCSLDISFLTKPLTEKLIKEVEEEKGKYKFTVNFSDLIDSQLEIFED
jgi:hypothetical protein